jgi:hypothetical protein
MSKPSCLRVPRPTGSSEIYFHLRLSHKGRLTGQPLGPPGVAFERYRAPATVKGRERRLIDSLSKPVSEGHDSSGQLNQTSTPSRIPSS